MAVSLEIRHLRVKVSSFVQQVTFLVDTPRDASRFQKRKAERRNAVAGLLRLKQEKLELDRNWRDSRPAAARNSRFRSLTTSQSVGLSSLRARRSSRASPETPSQFIKKKPDEMQTFFQPSLPGLYLACIPDPALGRHCSQALTPPRETRVGGPGLATPPDVPGYFHSPLTRLGTRPSKPPSRLFPRKFLVHATIAPRLVGADPCPVRIGISR